MLLEADQVAVVTGAAQGLGRALVAGLIDCGVSVVLADTATAECIDDLSPTNWRQKWNAIRWGGGTQIMPGWEKLVDTYMTELVICPSRTAPTCSP